MNSLPPNLMKIYGRLAYAQKLKKLATSSDAGVKLAAVTKLREINDSLFLMLKEAAVSAASVMDFGKNRVLPAAKDMLNQGKEYLPSLGKGLAMGAGAAVPLGIAGHYLAEDATTQARDKALQAGLGLAGIGGAMYGIHKGVSAFGGRDDRQKRSEEIQTKLATLGYLAEVLDGITETKIASEVAELKLRNIDSIISVFEDIIS